MGLSGFLYVAIVVGWAVYLVPYALKRYDEAARNRSIDRFSSAMRVLGRHDESVVDGDAPDMATDDVAAPRGPVVDSPAQRAAAQTAARRRRRVLLVLMSATAATAVAAWFLLVPMWSVAIPATLLLLWLVLCPVQARRERRARAARSRQDSVAPRQPRTAEAAEVAEDVARPAVHARSDVAARVDERASAQPYEQAHEVQPTADPVAAEAAATGDEEPTVVLERNRGPAEGDAAVGSLWDPVPVTLPTYVHKPRAPRTIRTIDLGSVGVQSSGRSDDVARGNQPGHAAETGPDGEAADGGGTEETQATSPRAVGE